MTPHRAQGKSKEGAGERLRTNVCSSRDGLEQKLGAERTVGQLNNFFSSFFFNASSEERKAPSRVDERKTEDLNGTS
jgi:hypothetical protein